MTKAFEKVLLAIIFLVVFELLGIGLMVLILRT